MKKRFYKIGALFMALMLVCAMFAGCAKTEVTLYADFSCGSATAEEDGLIKTEKATVKEITAENLAAALSKMTGLEFSVKQTALSDERITIDWQSDSTLLAGLGNTTLADGYDFYDADSLNWFMLDSLNRTLLFNLGVSEVYYTMNGGNTLVVTELTPVNEFPSDIAYMGSAFYAAHADNVGDEGTDADVDQGDTDQGDTDQDDTAAVDFSRTKGTWRIDDQDGTASIYMDGNGYFTTYVASGAKEFDGYLEYVDEYDDGNGRYDMYDMTGDWMNAFYFHAENELHMGNEDGFVYILQEEYAHEGENYVEPAALINPTRFSGSEVVETNNDYNGGYRYKDRTEDGLTLIVNCCFINVMDTSEGVEEYALWTAREIGGSTPEGFVCTQDDKLTANLTYPAYLLKWETGSNEDARIWDAVFFMTDSHTYLFAFETTMDNRDEMYDTWYETFEALTLE